MIMLRVRTRGVSLGFTLIELLIVLAIMATLMAIVAPRYTDSVDRAKEAVLKANLRMVRESIDKYKADTGKYPENLASLVEARYIKSMPFDPVADRSDTWVIVAHPNGTTTGVYDLHSGALGVGRNGEPYARW